MYTENIKAVQNLITNYFHGIFYGNTTKLESCFHEHAFLYGENKDDDYKKSVQEYIENVKNRQSPFELKEVFNMKIIGVDIIGKIAMAKLYVPMLGYNYYDYLSLVKTDNEWKIVTKLFVHVA